MVPTDYWQTVAKWIEEHHQWKVETEWMTYIPGIVKGIGMVVNVFVAPDEKVTAKENATTDSPCIQEHPQPSRTASSLKCGQP